MRPRLTYANVMASAAAFIALGGTSYAVTQLPRNSVGTPQLKSAAVTGAKVRNGSIGSADLASAARGQRGPRGGIGPSGPSGPDGSTGSRGPSELLLTRQESVNLSRQDGVFVDVITLQGVPAGGHLVMFNGSAEYRANGTRAYAICELRLNGTRVTATAGIIGEVAGSTGALPLSITEAVDQPGPFNLTVACRPSESAVAGQPTMSIGNVRLSAVRIGTVTIR